MKHAIITIKDCNICVVCGKIQPNKDDCIGYKAFISELHEESKDDDIYISKH